MTIYLIDHVLLTYSLLLYIYIMPLIVVPIVNINMWKVDIEVRNLRTNFAFPRGRNKAKEECP